MPRRVEKAPLTPLQSQAVTAGWVGLALLILGLVAWYATNTRTWYTNVVLGLGIIGLADWAAFAAPLVVARFSPRQLMEEANATLFILASIGIVIFLNVIAARRLGAYEMDLTKNKRYTLSSFSKGVVRKLPDKVQVTAFIPKPGPFTPQYGQQRQQAQDLLNQYQAVNPGVESRLVDPWAERTLATNKNVKGPWPILLFETAGKREEATQLTEKDVTAAFLKLQSGEKKKIYFLQGHGELDPDDFQPETSIGNVKQQLVDQQHEVGKLTLLGKTTSIPADAAVLVIAGPAYPLQPAETKAVQEYLNKGGHVLVLVGPSPRSPSFNELLKPWGVKVGNDLVVDLGNTILGTAIPAVVAYETHEITRDLRRAATAYPAARSVTPITPAPAGVTVTPLIKTSAQSWAETNPKGTPKLDPADTPGPVTLGVAITKDLSGPAPTGDKASGKTGKIARLVVIGSSEMASNQMTDARALPGNGDLLTVAVNWLAEEEALVNIPPKEETTQNITLTDPQRRVISTTVYALPLAAMLLGAIVWWKRR